MSEHKSKMRKWGSPIINNSARQHTLNAYAKHGLGSSEGPCLGNLQTPPRNRHSIPSNFTVIETNYSSNFILCYATLFLHQVIQIPYKSKQYLRLFTNHVWHTRSGRRVFCTDTSRLTIREFRARDVYATIGDVSTLYEHLFVIVSVIIRFRNVCIMFIKLKHFGCFKVCMVVLCTTEKYGICAKHSVKHLIFYTVALSVCCQINGVARLIAVAPSTLFDIVRHICQPATGLYNHRKLRVTMMLTLSSLMATGRCPDNLRCHAWRQNWYHNNFRIGMM